MCSFDFDQLNISVEVEKRNALNISFSFADLLSEKGGSYLMQFGEKATKKNYSHGYNDSRKEGRSSVYKF